MSVVACRITEDGYELASDSITVRGYTQTREKNTNSSKLFEINGMDIGCVGLAEEGSLLRLYASTNKPAAADERAILEFLTDFSDWKLKRTDERGIESSYFIGFGGKVFTVECWLVEEVLTFEAIGEGMDFALAALYLGHSAEKAVETAIELSIFCESPVKVIKRSR